MAEPAVSGETITLEVVHALPDDVTERFHQLYLGAFGSMAVRAVARQVLHPHEFFEEMRDPRVMKYVARDAVGEVVGLTTLTRDLETVPWISPQYFAARYPEHTARDAVFYLGFSLVAPQHQRSRVFLSMIEAVIDHVRATRGVCGWDVCAYNEKVLGFSDVIRTLLRHHTEYHVEEIDSQLYYAAETYGGPLRG